MRTCKIGVGLTVLGFGGLFQMSSLAGPKGAHVHGEGHMGLAIEAQKTGVAHVEVSAELTLPADSLFGFERRPRTETEWAKVTKDLDAVRNSAASWIVFESTLACRSQGVDLKIPERFVKSTTPEAPAQAQASDRSKEATSEQEKKTDNHGHGKQHEGHHGEHDKEHSDVELELRYHCDKNPVGTAMQFAGFEALPRLKKLNLQIVANDLQKAAVLTPKNRSLVMASKP